MAWSDIIGHEREKRFLQKLLTAKRRPHAFLFAGPAGIGKRLLADEFAAALLCGQEDGPCGKCLSCRQFRQGSHPDYFLLQPELKKDSQVRKDSIGINQIRELCEDAGFAPKQSPVRILLMDGAQLMTDEASNSLLKLLEEPPTRWMFLLVSDSLEALLPTIISRTIKVRMSSGTGPEVLAYLQNSSPALPHPEIAAALSCGSIGQAMRYGAADATRRRAMAFLKAAVFDECSALSGCLETLNALEKEQQKEEALLMCEFVAFFIRDAWQSSCGTANIWNVDSTAEMARLFSGTRVSYLKGLLRHTERAWCSLKQAANPPLILEGLFLEIAATGRS